MIYIYFTSLTITIQCIIGIWNVWERATRASLYMTMRIIKVYLFFFQKLLLNFFYFFCFRLIYIYIYYSGY